MRIVQRGGDGIAGQCADLAEAPYFADLLPALLRRRGNLP